ncbi:Hint domain-containing protein [Hyalangium rubrum]|uniref:Hint domain-containing protein n=1 Tax=Hyalangium rubrum TaxID=3103134 RepID=A0ABU5HHI8_9BACT|nr:Hint domain-containing protein [Hyalangium sp. s54d21]MDY7232924.1 Hint domain-containing protein [Hyalangium sp. s54d21]
MAARSVVQAMLYASLVLPALAGAQPILLQRCTADGLDAAGAEARVHWARRCALTLHVVYPSLGWDTGMPSANNAGNLIEYTEADPSSNWSGQNCYTGQSDSYDVNFSFVSKLFLSGPTNQYTDGAGFKSWLRSAARKKARPLYPIFGSSYDIYSTGNRQLFPHPTLTNCTLYLDRNGTQPATGYNFFLNGYCENASFTPEQKVLFSDGSMPIVDAVKSLREDLVTLTPNSTLDTVRLQQNQTYSYTADFRDSTHSILELRTASGGLLRVTEEHAIINSEGRMVSAQTLKVGDELLTMEGTRDPLVSIEKTTHYGKVYNLRPTSSDLVSNILVAEGYLVGSSAFLNDEIGYLNRIVLHKQIPPELIP